MKSNVSENGVTGILMKKSNCLIFIQLLMCPSVCSYFLTNIHGLQALLDPFASSYPQPPHTPPHHSLVSRWKTHDWFHLTSKERNTRPSDSFRVGALHNTFNPLAHALDGDRHYRRRGLPSPERILPKCWFTGE